MLTNLGTLAGLNDSVASGINDAGDVVGNSYGNGGASSDSQAFLYTTVSGMENLNNLIDPNSGWILQSATSTTIRGKSSVMVSILTDKDTHSCSTPCRSRHLFLFSVAQY